MVTDIHFQAYELDKRPMPANNGMTKMRLKKVTRNSPERALEEALNLINRIDGLDKLIHQIEKARATELPSRGGLDHSLVRNDYGRITK